MDTSTSAIFPFSVFGIYSFWVNLLKKENCQFELKFGVKTNLYMYNSMVVFILIVLDWKYPFWTNLVQKIKIVNSRWNFVPSLIEYAELNGGVHFFCFRPETTFLGKFGPKNKNYQFKLKFAA